LLMALGGLFAVTDRRYRMALKSREAVVGSLKGAMP